MGTLPLVGQVASFIWSVRLTYACLTHMERAIVELEGLGESETALAGQVFKGLGKVHGFAGQFLPRIFELARLQQRRDHGTEAASNLNRALELQTKLRGEKHKNTENVKRLLGRHVPSTDGGEHFAEEEDEEEAEAAVEERE